MVDVCIPTRCRFRSCARADIYPILKHGCKEWLTFAYRSVVGSGPMRWPGKSRSRRYWINEVLPTLNTNICIISSKYHTIFKVPQHHPLQSTTPYSSKYHTTLFKIPHHHLQSTTPPSSKYHITLFKVPYHPHQRTIPPSSKYHTTLFKVPQHPLRSTTPPSSKYHTTLFKVTPPSSKNHTPLQSITPPPAKYHTPFKVPHGSLQSSACIPVLTKK